MTHRSLLHDYRDSLRFPEFWMYCTWLELVTKYRRSRLGLLWAIVPPAIYAFGIGAFYGHLQGVDPLKEIPHLCLGYVVFRLIVTSLSEATTTFIGHSSFILDGRVRLTDYILRVIAKALFYFVLALPVVVAALAINASFHPLGIITLLPALVLVLANVAWMGVIVAVIGARLPDTHELVGSVLMFSFLFTPIIWHASQVPPGTMRGAVARANPLFHLIEVVRAPLLGEPVETMTLIYLLVMLVVGWTISIWVYRRYARFVPVWL